MTDTTTATTPPPTDAGATPPPATPPTADATTGTLLTSDPATTPPPTDDVAAKAAAEAKAKADADAAAAKAKAEGAPEKYEAFKFADGVTPAEADVQQFNTLARELNLSQANAQKLVDYQTTLMQRVEAESAKANAEVLKSWRTAVETDKEIGGSPEKVAEHVAVAKTALTKFGTPELMEFLKGGLGNHPEIIRAFYKVGKAISEDGHVPGTSGGAGQRSIGQLLFDKSNHTS